MKRTGHRRGASLRGRGAAALLFAASLTGCAINPATGQRQFSLIGEGQEIAMGTEYDQQIVATMGLYPDSSLQRYVQDLGKALAAKSERPNLPWTFRVLDDPVVNAFALPGGYIYITRGILAHLGSEAELAGVVGHEIGHVTGRHGVTQMSTQQIAQLGLAVGVALRPELTGVAQAANAGLGLLFLKHGRGDESQADELGLRYMLRGNYDPREMPGVFDMLDRVSQASGGGQVPEWLSTHPNPGNRRERISAEVARMPEQFEGKAVGRDGYLRRLQGLIFGEDPREGYFKGSQFFHPTLKFRLAFPEGWKTSNQKEAVIAASPQQDALIQVTLSKESSPDAAARAFFGQQGIDGGVSGSLRLDGLPATAGEFAAATESGRVRGQAMFVAHGGAVYQLLAYGAEGSWGNYQAAARKSLESFARLTDPAALAVQPRKLELVTLDRAMTLAEFAKSYPSTVPMETLALINRAEPGTRFEKGAVVKRVVGQGN